MNPELPIEAASPVAVSLPPMMRASVARQYGTADVLAVEDVPVPTAGKKEVLVRVEASSLNALDWHFLTGTPYLLRLVSGLRRPKRIIRGADVAGTVVAVGANVTRFRPGDEVFGERDAGGGFAPFIAVKEKHLAAKPPGVTFEVAAATPVAGLTAVQGLKTKAKLQPGERVLINGAAGGVGTFAVQLAKAMGATVTAVCSSRNVEMVRSVGADEVIDYTTQDFVDGGPRFDVMMDNVGNRTPGECLSVLKPGARYLAVSGPKENRWIDPLPYLARSSLKFLTADASLLQYTATPNQDDLTFLGELLNDGRLAPVIDRVVGLDGVAEGLAEIGTGHARAKIVVVPQR